MQISAIPLEKFMGCDFQKDIEIARRTAAQPGFALTRKADAGPILYTGRNIDRERALARDAPAAATDLARIVYDLSAAMAGWARALEREKTLRVPDLAGAAAGRTGFWFRSGLGAAPRAGLAGDRRRNADLGGFARKSLLKANFHVVAQVGSAFATGSASPRRSHSENALKNIGEGRPEIGAETMRAHSPMFERGVTKTVVGGAFVAVL